jgi:hypothetical protein
VKTLYVLQDPRDSGIRWIGQTGKLLCIRKAHHLDGSTNERKDAWILDLLQNGLQPEIKALAILTDADAVPTERRLIQRLIDKGAPLLNIPPEELGRRISEALVGKRHSEESYAQQRESMQKFWTPERREEHAEKLREYNRRRRAAEEL